MIVYIIKFIVCSGFLYSFYKVFLERESMYKMNRFYLLLSLLFSIVSPLYKMELPMTIEETKISPELVEYLIANPQLIENNTNWNYGDIINLFYGIIGLGLFLRFVLNIFTIYYRIKNDEKYEMNDITIVLNHSTNQPFSFLSYIFLPKNNIDEIHPNLIQHEKAHCKQKHSLDILFIELFQIVFWFNPFIYLYKKSIKLNHEFLADEYVLQNNVDVKTYQLQILDCIATQSQNIVASHFNFILTKKRLLMMTKQTSKRKVRILSFATLPFLLSAFLLFSEKTFAQEVNNSAKSVEKILKVNINNPTNDIIKFRVNINDTISKGNVIELDGEIVELDDQIKGSNKKQNGELSDIVTIVKMNNDTIKFKVQSVFNPNEQRVIKIDQLQKNDLLTDRIKSKLIEIYPTGIQSFEIHKKNNNSFIKVDGKEYLITENLDVLKELSNNHKIIIEDGEVIPSLNKRISIVIPSNKNNIIDDLSNDDKKIIELAKNSILQSKNELDKIKSSLDPVFTTNFYFEDSEKTKEHVEKELKDIKKKEKSLKKLIKDLNKKEKNTK